MPHWRKGSECTLKIESLGSNGEGVARLDGLVVFLPGGLPGEEWRVRLSKVNKSVAWAEGTKQLSSSTDRIDPACPYFPECGGCQLQHATYELECSAKRTHVQDCIQRIGGINVPVSEYLQADTTTRYRNKGQFPVGVDADGNAKIGFFKGRTHNVIDVKDCLLQSESTSIARRVIKEWMKKYGVSAYNERTHSGLLRHVYVRTVSTGDVLVCIVINGTKAPAETKLQYALISAIPSLVGIVINTNTEKTNVILGDTYRTLWGQNYLTETLCGFSFQLSVPSFFQVNHVQTEKLYQKALEYCALDGHETVLDLYCGIGTITSVLSTKAKRVIGAEIVPEAIEDAKENAKRNGINNIEFYCADAGAIAKELLDNGLTPDVVTVDPPRKGLLPGVAETIASMSPSRIVYVSCDPSTLARDLKIFSSLNYVVEKVSAADLFPRTRHVETVCLLSRK